MSKEEETPDVIKRCIEYCWDRKFLDIFRKYFRDNAAAFIGYPPKRDMESAEHSLEHWTLFQNYLKLYEDTLHDWLSTEKVDQAEFYRMVQQTKEYSVDPREQEFVHCLLASCDYDSFYSVMVREADRLGAAPGGGGPPAPAESKSEGKDADDDEDDAKGGGGGGAKGAK